MNKNIDADKQKKVDQMLHALGELPDEMIAQANPDLQKKAQKHKRKNVFFIPRVLAAVAILFLGIGICFWVQERVSQHKATNKVKYQTASDAVVSIPKITVVAYAAQSHTADDMTSENAKIAQTPTASPKETANPAESELTGYDAVELTKTKVTISEYSLAMSSAPAMPFSFQTTSDSKSIHIQVKSNGKGVLQKWDISNEDGTWKLQAEGKKIKCKPDEVIYWKPKNDTGKIEHLIVNIYDGDTLLEQKTIEITCKDKMTYQAHLIP